MVNRIENNNKGGGYFKLFSLYLHKHLNINKMEDEKWALIERSKRFKQVRFYISSLGNIKSIDIMKNKEYGCTAYVNEKGYLEMKKKSTAEAKGLKVRLHQEVGKHFVPGYFVGAVLNHMDKIRTNCRADNLEWVTEAENDLHGKMAYTGSAKGLKPGDYPLADYITKTSKSVCCFDLNGVFIERFPSINATAKKLGIKPQRVADVIRGYKHGTPPQKKSSHKGFVFKYG